MRVSSDERMLHRLQPIRQGQGRGNSLLRILLQELQDDALELLRRIGGEAADRNRRSFLQGGDHLHDRLAGERRPAGEQGIEHAPQSVQIAAAGDRLAVGLLRGHVVGRAEHAAIGRHVRAAVQLGDAEVGELDVVLLVDQQVGRLEIAMDDAAVVGVLEGLLPRRRRSGPPRAR